MNLSSNYSIAGVSLRIEPPWSEKTIARNEQESSASRDEHIVVSMKREKWSSRNETTPSNIVFDSKNWWSLGETRENIVFRPYLPGRQTRKGGEALISKDFRSVTLFGIDPSISTLPYPLDEVVFMHLLPDMGGVLVHASAVVLNGEALLFAGPSGVGKTTIADYWQNRRGAKPLSDDRTALRIHDGAIWAYGTPWRGKREKENQEGVRLREIHVVRRGEKNKIQKMKIATAVKAMLQVSILPHWDAFRLKNAMEIIDAVASATQINLFEFMDDGENLDSIWP